MFSKVLMPNSVVLYWDLPENYEAGDNYIVYKNGEIAGETEKCHFEVEKLSPETEYSFKVVMKKNNGEPTEIGETTSKTLKEKRRIDISKAPYNALGDGKTLNTESIQRAIDNCKEDECVYIPSGDFMTGALRLHSDMELYLEKDAILHGTCEVKDYLPKIKSRFEGIENMSYSSLLNIGELDREKGISCKNVRICGEGTICSGGRTLADNVVEIENVLMKDYIESLGEKVKECETNKTIPGRVRPRLINVSCAENVLISGVKLKDGASWNVHMIYSKNIVTCGCEIHSKNVWNGDGWDPDSSSDCTLFNCDFYTGDDCVAIKSGKNPEGNVINIPCENIRVFDITAYCGHGIAIGSEMSGGVKNVRIWNCNLEKAAHGIHIKGSKDRGGYIRDVSVKYVSAGRIRIRPTGCNNDGESADTIPDFTNLTFENIKLTGHFVSRTGEIHDCPAIEIRGLDDTGHTIRNIKFKNITIFDGNKAAEHNILLQGCENISIENICSK